MIGRLANFLGFQAGWFACILGAAAGRPWVGLIVVAGLVAAHLLLVRGRLGELLLVLAAAALGYIADSILVFGGALQFPSEAAMGAPAPAWMVAMWANFALTLHWSMRWLVGRPVVGALLGAVAGPAAYFAGARLGAVSLGDPLPVSLAAVAVEWAVAMPVLLSLAAHTAGRSRSAPSEGSEPAMETTA